MTFENFFYRQIINECTSIGLSIGEHIILAKNRDRTYYPKVKLVRELINDIEVVYMYDIDTDYAEGMNEYGIGIVNTTLQGKKDENEGSSKNKNRKSKLNEDGFKIRKALGYNSIKQVVKCLDLFKRGLGGHTTVGYPNGFISIEKLRFGKPVIKKMDASQVVVRANHGLAYPDQGYQYGKNRESSLSRVFYATKEGRKAESPDELLYALRKHHDVQGYLEPYRTNYHVWTSSQIMMDLTDLKLTFIVDENATFQGIENRLPEGYIPKIKIEVRKLETVFNVRSI
jgi:hypothetical protein